MSRYAEDTQIDWTGFFDGDMTEKFLEFHRENPHIVMEIANRAMTLKSRGHRKVGMGMLFEVLRWNHMLKTSSDEPFKLNNNYRAYYSRLVEELYPQLSGLFTRRASKADESSLVD